MAVQDNKIHRIIRNILKSEILLSSLILLDEILNVSLLEFQFHK